MSIFVDRLNARMTRTDSLLCVGLDSRLDLLPPEFRTNSQPQFDFNRWIIRQTHPYAAAYKLNMAFYEARGDAGLRDLKSTLDYLRDRHPDILTLCDAKRADIGSTNDGYVEAIFNWLGFDAVTLNPYLGGEALAPFLRRTEKGCIILCRTSNPGAGELQDLLVEGRPLWQAVAAKVRDEWNVHGNCMLVMGATYPDELRQARALVGEMPMLVPGVGAQGGDPTEATLAGQDTHGRGLILNASRAVIFAPDPAAAARDLRDAINRGRRTGDR